jgi:hypothetical protein
MNVPDSLDSFVRRTGLYGATMIERREPRNLRWLPLLLILGLVGGYAFATPEFGLAEQPVAILTGGLVFYLAFGASIYVRFFGPRLIPAAGEALDERELVLKARATAASGQVTAILAMSACFYFAIASTLRWWMPAVSTQWVMLGFGVQGLHFTLPVLFASWMQPRLGAEA